MTAQHHFALTPSSQPSVRTILICSRRIVSQMLRIFCARILATSQVSWLFFARASIEQISSSDPHFCQIYHICDAAFGTSVAYTCPTEYVFHGPTRHCMLQTSPSDCITMSHNCEENDRVWAKYDEESDFFAFCPGNSILQNGFDDIIMYRCEEGHLFDGLHCISDGNLPSPPGPPGPPGPPSPPGTTPPPVPPGEINCPHVGRFPFPNDPTRFIVCFTNSQGIMNYMIRPCAPNFIFNPDIQLCERVPSRIKGYIE